MTEGTQLAIVYCRDGKAYGGVAYGSDLFGLWGVMIDEPRDMVADRELEIGKIFVPVANIAAIAPAESEGLSDD